MFCSNCGSQLPEGSTTCSKCDINIAAVSKTENAFLAVLLGFLILLLSYFTMPFKTLKLSIAQLKEVGAKGKFDVASTEIPHLTWMGVAGCVLGSMLVVVVIVVSIVMGLGQGGVAIIVSPLIGFIVAITLDWSIMIWIEIIMLLASITNDVRKIANR